MRERMSNETTDIATAIATVRDGDRYELEPACDDERVRFLNISEAEVNGFEIEIKVSVGKAAVPDDIVPVTTAKDRREATGLVEALGREGVFAKLVDAVSNAYDLPRGPIIEQLETDLHCTRAWPDQSSVSTVLFQTRLAGSPDGIRSVRLHADELSY